MMIAHLSDLHIDAPGSLHVRRAARMFETLAGVRPRPRLLLLTGDLTQHGTPSQYAVLRSLLPPDLPLACVAGNHDDAARVHASFPGSSPPAGGYLRLSADALDVLLVDTAVAGEEHGALSTAQLDGMARELAGSRRPTVIAMHHPPGPHGMPALDAISLRDTPAFENWLQGRPQVVAVLAGHHHQARMSHLAGRPVLVAPSVAPALAPDFTATRFRTVPAEPGAYVHRWTGALSTHLLMAASTTREPADPELAP